MAKKKVQTPKKIKPVSKQINCKCGSEWDRVDVEADETIHTSDNFHFRFLRRFRTNSSGFHILLALLGCPDCRDKK